MTTREHGMSTVGAATGDLMDIKGFVQNLPCPSLASGSRELVPPLTGDSTQESNKVELALALGTGLGTAPRCDCGR